MQVCGIFAIFCAFGSVMFVGCGINCGDWKMAVAGIVVSGMLSWLAVFLIHHGLDLTDTATITSAKFQA